MFYTAKDLQTLQRAVSDDYKLLDPAVMACNAESKVNDTDLGAWDVMQGRVAAFTRLDADPLSLDTQIDQGKALQADLLTWHAKVKAMGCNVPDAPTPVVPTSGFGGLQDALSSLFQPQVLTLALIVAALFLLDKPRR